MAGATMAKTFGDQLEDLIDANLEASNTTIEDIISALRTKIDALAEEMNNQLK